MKSDYHKFPLFFFFFFCSQLMAQPMPSADELLKKLELANTAEKVPILLELATYFEENKNIDSAIVFANRALSIADRTQQKNDLYLANYQIGTLHRQNNQFEKAITFYKEGLENCGDSIKLAELQNEIAVSHYYLGNYKASLVAYLQALGIYERREEAIEVARMYSNIGLVYYVIMDYDNAILNYDRAEKIYRQLDNNKGVIKQLSNKGIIYWKRENISEATNLFKQVITYTDSVPYNTSRGSAFHNLGGIAAEKGELEEALDYFLSSLKIDEYHNRSNNIVISYHSIGKLYQEVGDFKRAEQYLLKGWNLADTLSLQKELMDISGALAEFYDKKNQPKAAFKYLGLHTQLKDTIYNIRQTAVIHDLQTKYETAQKEQEIVTLNKENALQRKLNWWSIAGFLLVLTMLGLLLYNLRLRNAVLRERAAQEKSAHELEVIKNEKLKLELAAKNRELTTFALQSYQKNELLAKVQQQIQKLKKSANIDKAIDKVTKNLAAHIQLEDEWNTFKLHFEEVHPHFFSTLQNQYPKLTQVELKQCAYVKIGLSSKEIARLLNINTSSVHVAHYRIKKKMVLDTEVSLQDFVQKIS